MIAQLVAHDCDGVAHFAELEAKHLDILGCGCTRSRGRRCDGTPVEWLDGKCDRHEAADEVPA